MTVASRFDYEAARTDGQLERGVVMADGRGSAERTLASRGLFILSLARVAVPSADRIAGRDVATGLRVLATLMATGIPVGRALSAFEELAPGKWRAWTPMLRQRIREGSTFADALEQLPLDNSAVLVGTIRAGERGGSLAAALGRAASFAETSQSARDAVMAALAYPIVLAVAGTLSLAIMLGTVVPRFAGILADLGQELPPATRALIAITGTLRAFVLPGLVLGVVAIIVIAGWVKRDPEAQRRLAALWLRLPVVGVIRHALATSRVAAALSGMLESGLTVASALITAGGASGDAEIEARIRRARDRILGGSSLSTALRAENAVTKAALQLIRAGEEAGRPAELMAQVALIEEARSRRTIQVAVRVLEPLLIFAFAVVTAFVAAALLQAVYAVRPL